VYGSFDCRQTYKQIASPTKVIILVENVEPLSSFYVTVNSTRYLKGSNIRSALFEVTHGAIMQVFMLQKSLRTLDQN
jgi:hypothetical protein